MAWLQSSPVAEGYLRPRFKQEGNFDCGLACAVVVHARMAHGGAIKSGLYEYWLLHAQRLGYTPSSGTNQTQLDRIGDDLIGHFHTTAIGVLRRTSGRKIDFASLPADPNAEPAALTEDDLGGGLFG